MSRSGSALSRRESEGGARIRTPAAQALETVIATPSESLVDRVRAAVSEVKDPALDMSLAAAAMLKAVGAGSAAGEVVVDVELTSPACPSRSAIGRAVEAAARAVDGVTGVAVRYSAPSA